MRHTMLIGHDASDGSELALMVSWHCLCVSLTEIRHLQSQRKYRLILPEWRMSRGADPCAVIQGISTEQFYLYYVLNRGTSVHDKTSLEIISQD